MPYLILNIPFITVVTLLVALVISRVLRVLLSKFLGAIIFIFYTIPALKTLSITLFSGAGVLTAIILFASRQAFSNIVSGVFIVIFKPFRVNDLVDVGISYDSDIDKAMEIMRFDAEGIEIPFPYRTIVYKKDL